MTTWKHCDIIRYNCTFYIEGGFPQLCKGDDDEGDDEEGDDDEGDDAITRQKGRPPTPSVFLRWRWWQNLGWSRGGWEPLLLLQYIIFCCKGHKTLAPQTSVFPRTLAPLDIFWANNSQRQTKNVWPKVFRTYVTKYVFRVKISYQMWGANGWGLNLPKGG